jgi:hypothetical protein
MKYKKPLIINVITAPKSAKKICNADAFSCYISKDIRNLEPKIELQINDKKSQPTQPSTMSGRTCQR